MGKTNTHYSNIPSFQFAFSVEKFEGGIMAVTREEVVRLVAEKVGPAVGVEAKMEKGFWRVTLTKEGKTSLLELKRGFLEDYLERGEYQQEIAFETRINKALKGLS
jgi:hypothetical protein